MESDPGIFFYEPTYLRPRNVCHFEFESQPLDQFHAVITHCVHHSTADNDSSYNMKGAMAGGHTDLS